MSDRQNGSGPQFRADRPIEQEAVRTTIVGGRPPGSGKGLGPIPRGIEVLVKKASVDPEFRTLLLEKRAEAADEIGLKLDAAEVMMLCAVPAAQLEIIIGQTDVPQQHRRAFLGKAAAAMLVALGVSVPGCDGPGPDKGVRPDRIESPPGGARPEGPLKHRTDDDLGKTGGCEPDLPEPPEPLQRPREVEPSHGDRPPPEDYDNPPTAEEPERPKKLPICYGIRPKEEDFPEP